MTLRPDQIGDKGRRWEVRALGYPDADGWATVGWTDTRSGARTMAAAIQLHPNCTGTCIIDRWRGRQTCWNRK